MINTKLAAISMMVFAVAMVGTSSIMSASATSNLVVNGSFEDPVIAVGSWIVFWNGIPGWITGPNGIELQNAAVATASDGVNYAELDVYRNSNILQTLSTVEGQVYSLSFDYSPRINRAADTNPIEAYWDGALLDTITADGMGLSNNAWTTHTYYVVAASGNSTNIEFKAVGISDAFGGNIDNVIVEDLPKKVDVCHKGKKTINISSNAVPAHLAHGDTVGICQ